MRILLAGFEVDFVYDHGAYSEMADILASKAIRFAGFGYNIPSVRALARVGFSNQTYGTAYRSYGNSQAYAMSENLVDILAVTAERRALLFHLATDGKTVKR